MADPFSVTVDIIAVLQFISGVCEYGLDFAEADKAIMSLNGEFESLQHLLERLKNRCESAQCQEILPSWLQDLWEVRPTPDKKEYEIGGF